MVPVAVEKNVEVSLDAIRGFRARVEALNLWRGAWVTGVLIRRENKWVLFLLRAFLQGPGVRVPSPDRVFDVTCENVRSRSFAFETVEGAWTLLEALARGEEADLNALFGVTVELPRDDAPRAWWSNPTTRGSERAHFELTWRGASEFHKLFGFPLFDKVCGELKANEQPYENLRELANNLAFDSSNQCDGHGAVPLYEVTAELPIQFDGFSYNTAREGFEFDISTGSSVDLKRLKVSVTPTPRRLLRGSELVSTRIDGLRRLTGFLDAKEPKEEVTASVTYDDIIIASRTVHPKTRFPIAWPGDADSSAIPDWEKTLERVYHWSSRSLRRALRKGLAASVADVAFERVADSIALQEKHPFYAVVSAASVAEILLKERIGRVSARTRMRRWATLRQAEALLHPKKKPLPKKPPAPQSLTFDQATRLGEELGLLDGVNRAAVETLRVARNHVHISAASTPMPEQFSPARASQALLATLDLCKSLAALPRARPLRRRSAASVGAAPAAGSASP